MNAKTDAECDKYLAMVSNSAVASNEAFIGTDKRDRIGPFEPGYGLRLSTKDILHTESKVPVRNNPGTRFKVTGYLEAGTTCTGVQMTGFAIKGWGDDSWTVGYLYYVTYGGVSGWLAPENCVVQYYDTPDRKNAYDAWVDYLK